MLNSKFWLFILSHKIVPLVVPSIFRLPGSSGKSTPESIRTPRSEAEILQSPNLKAFTLTELKNASRNFRPDSLLGEGGFGHVYKAWLDKETLAAARPGTGMIVAVKKLKPEGFQGHREWLVGTLSFELVCLYRPIVLSPSTNCFLVAV